MLEEEVESALILELEVGSSCQIVRGPSHLTIWRFVPLLDTNSKRPTKMGNAVSSKHDKLTVSVATPPLTDSETSDVTKSMRASNRQANSTRSETTTSSFGSIKAASLLENLMRCQHRDPLEIYEVISILGEGSMVSG